MSFTDWRLESGECDNTMSCQHHGWQWNFDQDLLLWTHKILLSCLVLNIIFVVGTERDIERLVHCEVEVIARRLCDYMRVERSLIIKSVGKVSSVCVSQLN